MLLSSGNFFNGSGGGGGGSGETGADLAAAIIPFTTPVVTTGTQNLTSSAYGGGTPILAMFNTGETTALKNNEPEIMIGFGATDGTNQFAANAYSADAQTSGGGADRRVGVTDKCMLRLGLSIGSEAAYSSFLTDGVQVNHTDDWPSAYHQHAIVAGGSDLTTAVGTVTPTTGGVTVTLGWQPDAIIFYGVNDAMNDSVGSFCSACMGFAAWDSGASLTEVVAGVTADTGTTRLYRVAVETTACHAQIDVTSSSYTFTINVTRSGTGFTATSSSTVGTDKIGYIALKIAGGQAKAGTWALPTGTGSASKTGVGFKPRLVILAGTDRTATGVAAGSLFGIAALAREPRAAGIFSSFVSDGAAQNGSNPSDTRHTVDDNGLYGLLAAGGADFDIDLTSLDADGWTVNVTDAPAGAYLWPYLAIG